MPWITTKEGKHINTDWFDEKERQIAENKKQADKLNGKLVTAVHFTPSEDNVKSIIENGFDMNRAGEEGGDYWGKAIYFSTEKQEQDFYSTKFKSSSSVSADIDTSNMITIKFHGKVYSPNNMYELAAEQLPKNLKAEYDNIRATGKGTPRKILSRLISENYTGIVIKQDGVDGVEGTTGGNQIVIYDKSVIHDIRKN